MDFLLITNSSEWVKKEFDGLRSQIVSSNEGGENRIIVATFWMDGVGAKKKLIVIATTNLQTLNLIP